MTLAAVSEIAREVDRALVALSVACLILLAGITIAMIYFAFKYRRSQTKTTKQIYGNTVLEITWIVVPTIIVTWMFFVGYKGFALMRDVPEGAMVVKVTGQRWLWSFHYPDAKVDTNEMVVPVNTPIKVELTSPPDDVVHSFYLPDFRVKEDAVPGKQTYLWFQADREGTYNIFCAEFCGKDHSKMLSILKVVSQREFDDWVRETKSKKYQPLVFEAITNPEQKDFGPEGLNINAAVLYKTFCQTCHGENGDGSGLPGVARDFTSTEGWKRSTKVVDIYRTLTEGIDGTQMRAFPNLAPWERVALAHYVRKFVPGDPGQDTQEDYDALVKEYELDKVQAPGETIPIDRAMELLSAAAPADSDS